MPINPSWAQFLKDFEVPLIFGGLLFLVAVATFAYYVIYRRPGRRNKSGRHSHHSERKSRPASSLVKDLKLLAGSLQEKPKPHPHRSYQPLGAENLPPLKAAPVAEVGPENRPTGI